MRILLIVTCLLIINGAVTVFAEPDPQPATEKAAPKPENDQKSLIDEIKGMQRDVSELSQSAVGKYAREFLDKSKNELQNAQLGSESGKTAEARRSLELAGILVLRAKAVTAEQESVEKAAIKKAELRKLEERIDTLLKGKEK